MKSSSKGIGVGELVIELVIKTCYELGENQWLGVSTKVFLEVESGEGLSNQLIAKALIGCQVGSIDESITIDSFSLMHPKFDKVVWF